MRALKLSLVMATLMVAGSIITASNAMAGSLAIKMKADLGNYLTDDKGMSLYIFKKDGPGKSACAGPCVDKWPIFHMDDPTLPSGITKTDLGTITREDGKMQSTYKGLPLYYFFKDKEAGDTNGQGFNNVWYVAVP